MAKIYKLQIWLIDDGDIVTVKQEPHILDYLLKEFGNNAIKNET